MANLTHGGTTVTTTASWEGSSIELTKQSSKLHFSTGKKYVDQDIDVQLDVASGNVDKTSIGYGESATITAGWIPATTITNSVSAGTIKADNKSVTASISSTANDDGSYNFTGSQTLTASSTTAGYVSSTVGTKNTGTATITGSVSGSTLKNGTTTIASASTITPNANTQTVTISAGYYPTDRIVKVGPASSSSKATIQASATDPGTSYTSQKITLASDGYLKINAGYIGNTKISLADLVPDDADITASESSPYILTGHSAYDKDGKLIVGGINNGEITNNVAANADITSTGTIDRGKLIKVGAGYYGSDVYYTAQANSGSTTITSKTQSVDGYASATVTDHTGSASSGSATGTVSNGDGITLGTAQTTAPASGRYLTVNGSGKYNVTKAGWITTGEKTGGSATTYYPISIRDHAGSASSGAANATGTNITLGTKTTTKPSSGSYITVTGSGKYNVTTAGWITTGEKTGGSATAYYPIATSTLTHSGVSGDAGSVAIGHTEAIVKTSATATTAYIDISATPSSGTITHDATTTAGYTAGETKSATITATPGYSGDGKVYFATSSLSGTNASPAVTSGYTAPTYKTSQPTTPYLRIGASAGGATVGNVITSTGSTTYRYIDMYDGSYTIS